MTLPAVWIRHATSVDGLERPAAHARPDTPLSDRGPVEAHRAAAGLVELGVGRVLSSPLPRAWETARILADDLGAALDEPYPQLREWQAPDCVLGIASPDYPPQYLRWHRIRSADPNSALPGGESLTAFARRAADAAELAEAIAAGAAERARGGARPDHRRRRRPRHRTPRTGRGVRCGDPLHVAARGLLAATGR